MFCQKCGKNLADDVKFCDGCGTTNFSSNPTEEKITENVTTRKAVDEAYCSSCGAIIKKDAEICVKCGVRQKMESKGQNPVADKKMLVGLMGIFLGSLGVHKFLLGKIGLGILYAVFCWTTIPGIIGFIEGIIILTMSDDTFAEKHMQ